MRSTEFSRVEPAHAKVPTKPIKLINSNDIIFFMNCPLEVRNTKEEKTSDGLT